MTISYDESADTLYITIRQGPAKCHYVENADGHTLTVDTGNSEIVGVTIPAFSRRIKQGEISLPELSSLSVYASDELMTVQ